MWSILCNDSTVQVRDKKQEVGRPRGRKRLGLRERLIKNNQLIVLIVICMACETKQKTHKSRETKKYIEQFI